MADRPVLGRQAFEAGAKRAGRTLAVDADPAFLSVNLVLFGLAHVVGDVVDLVEMHIGGPAAQGLGEGLAGKVGEDLAVRKGVVGGSPHGTLVGLPLR